MAAWLRASPDSRRACHEVAIEFGWVNNYNSEPEKEFDGSRLGNAGPMARGGPAPSRRLLLVW
jgi:hypothetical protein